MEFLWEIYLSECFMMSAEIISPNLLVLFTSFCAGVIPRWPFLLTSYIRAAIDDLKLSVTQKLCNVRQREATLMELLKKNGCILSLQESCQWTKIYLGRVDVCVKWIYSVLGCEMGSAHQPSATGTHPSQVFFVGMNIQCCLCPTSQLLKIWIFMWTCLIFMLKYNF